MVAEAMPGDAVEDVRKHLTLAAEDLDGNRVAALVVEAAGRWGVTAVWERVCAPMLAALRAAAAAYAAIDRDGHAGAVPRLAWSSFTALVGQDDALTLDRRYA